MNKIICGDCIKIMKTFYSNSINLIVTSPPYWNLHKYSNSKEEIGYNQSLEKYLDSMNQVFSQFYKILKNNGNIWLNIMDLYRETKVVRLSDMIIDIAIKNNLILVERVIWYVINKPPVVNKKYLVHKYEWLLHFVKTDKYKFYPDRMRTYSPWSTKDSRYWKYNDKGALLGNVWSILAKYKPEPVNPAMFPLEIPYRCISGWSDKGDVILDLFVGSGTTVYASIELKRHYIGIDINPEYVKHINKKLQQGRLF